MANNKRGNRSQNMTPASIAGRQLKLLKARNVYHQPHKPKSPMDISDEATVIDFCFVLFVVLTMHVGPALWDFLTRRGKNDPPCLIVDIYKFLKLIILNRTQNPSFFTTNSATDLSDLDTAQQGRLAVAHGYFDEVSNNWSDYLLSWIKVLKMVDAPEAANKVKKIHELLVAGNITALDILLCSYTAPDFMEHGTKIKKPTDMTRARYRNAIRLQMKLYECLTKIFAPALRDENMSRTGQVRDDSEIDSQNLLFDLLEYWYKQPLHPDMLANTQLLEAAKKGRNIVCHGDLNLIATDWQHYLTSWREVCVLISNNDAAQRLSSFHQELIAELNLPFTGSFLPTPTKASIRSKAMLRIKLSKKP